MRRTGSFAVLAVLAAFAAMMPTAASADVEICFLRHGETSWNRAKILQGSIPYTDLTSKGRRMAKETAKGMAAAGIRFGRIYTSPYRRARHTAEIVSSAWGGPAPVDDIRLREMCFGRYEGVRYSEGQYPDENLRRFFEEPDRYVPSGDGAESFADVRARLRDFLEKEVRPLDGKVERVLCVAHSLVLRALVMEIAGDSATAEAKKTIQKNCCVHTVLYSGGRFTMKDTGRIFYSAEAFGAAPEPKMVAHRGAGDLSMPEASLPAYSNAVATVCDIVKLDVQCTKDGVPVMGHDGKLSRVMGWNVAIADLDYAELFERGRFLEKGRPGSWRIVRLDEALAIVKPVPEFWIDFKSFSEGLAEKKRAALAAAGIDESRVMVATFNRPALDYFRRRHPNIRRIGHFSGQKGEGARISTEEALRLSDEYGLYGLNLPIKGRQTQAEDVAILKKSGLWISLWFVQDAATAAYCRTLSADAFVTDHVSRVRKRK